MMLRDRIKYFGRIRDGAELELNPKQKNQLEYLRKFGCLVFDNLLSHSEVERLQSHYKIELEENLNFETPCLSQNHIKLEEHRELIENKFLYTPEQLFDKGIAFSENEMESYKQIIEDFRPSTLKTYIPHDQLFFETWLHPEILKIIEAYMGLRPHLSEAYVRRNFPADYKVMNHYWHRDLNHKDYLLKAFIFLSDCELEHGPHEYIRGSVKDLRLNGKNYYSDDEVDNIYPQDSPERMLSVVKSGTVILEDTRGLHRARIPDKEYRDLGYAIFVPTRIFNKHKTQHYTIDRKNYENLSDTQKSYIPKEFIV